MTRNLKILYPDIPFAAQSITANISSSTYLKRTITGSRCDFHSLSARSADDLWINYDLGSGYSQAASYLAIADADKLTGKTVDKAILRGSAQSAFTPSSISGLRAWYDGTRAVFHSNGIVTQWDDLSGYGNHLTQTTSAKRPARTRSDNKENLIAYSQNFSNAEWDLYQYGANPVVVTSNTTTAPDGTTTGSTITAGSGTQLWGFRYQQSATFPITTNSSADKRFSVYLKYNNYANVWVGEVNDAAWHGAAFNISTGTYIGKTNLTGTPTIESVGNGWYRIMMVIPSVDDHRMGAAVYFNNGNVGSPASLTLTGSEAFYCWGAQVQQTDRDTDYISTSGYRQPGGVNKNTAIFFDGLANYLDGNSLSSYFTGNDTPYSFLAVIKKYSSASEDTIFSAGNSGTNTPYVRLRTSGTTSYRIDRVDDAAGGAAANPAQAVTSNTRIIAVSFSGSSVSVWEDGTKYVNGSAHNVGTITLNVGALGVLKRVGQLDYLDGIICEFCLYNVALSDSDIDALNVYAASKWQTTPVLSSLDIDSTDLVGTASQDYSESTTESSAFRHWWLQLGNSNDDGSDYRFSKAYFGAPFDFNRDPVWGRSWITLAPHQGTRRQVWNFSFTWQGISDAKVTEFVTKIGKYKDVNPVWLSTNSYHDVLGDAEAVYCTITEYSITPECVNNNEITIDFQEMI